MTAAEKKALKALFKEVDTLKAQLKARVTTTPGFITKLSKRQPTQLSNAVVTAAAVASILIVS
jgi:hypothetical protein